MIQDLMDHNDPYDPSRWIIVPAYDPVNTCLQVSGYSRASSVPFKRPCPTFPGARVLVRNIYAGKLIQEY
jgi:hypothetical protein